MKAMILAAGLGTRFKPWTDQHPKALAIINGKSLLERNIHYLQQFGIFDVLVNVHHFADQIIDAVETNDAWGSRVTISDESDEVLETGGGLKKAAWFLSDTPFVLMNADILTDLDLGTIINFHERQSPLATLAVTNRASSRYFLFDEEDQLRGWRNVNTGEERLVNDTPQKHWPGNDAESVTDSELILENPPALLSEKAFSGIHIISPAIFPLMKQQGKFSMVGVYLQLAATHKILGFDHSGSKLVDVGRQESVAVAETLFP
jgi:NDP-sugar pyrophosphorylase family protein